MIHGTGRADTIYGHKGWDYIGTSGGDDVVHGGLGMEIIQGVDGDDVVYGEMGHDHVSGGRGNDRLYLQDGKDERGNVEQVVGKDPRDGIVAHKSCETLEIKPVPNMAGATRIYNTHNGMKRGHTIPGKFYPGTYHLD